MGTGRGVRRYLRLAEQRAIFAALVAEQDRGASVADSRQEIAARYGITVARVREIEEVGIMDDWPPFDE
jgi:hypothetical protein